ncbi:hypothetical protein L218DRAFT_1006154 [Marasmius fiardii PR-910]|nr:hypothetical protein L218DRAFT_1006154 [Marasmius fiardii PR-910]
MSDSQAQQSGPLADQDIADLKAEMVETAVGFVLYGVYATFSIITVYLFLARGLHQSKARVVLFIITIVMFLLSTCSLILDLEFNLLLFSGYSFSPPNPNVFLPLLIKLSITLNLFERLIYLISDGIVVWRAWAFYPRSFVVKLILSTCLLASAGTFVLFPDA